MVTSFGLIVLVIPLFVGSASAQQDPTDLYVDLSFTCPVTTTCPQVCAESRADCPETLKCKNGNETLQLCADGSCAMLCDPTLTSPCEETNACAPVTCASINTYYGACFEDYGPWYEYVSLCPVALDDGASLASPTSSLYWSSPTYITMYCWVAIVTLAIISWCWYK
jgi:hypothetical protein